MNGTGVSPGISIGRAFVIKKDRRAMTGLRIDGEQAIIGEMDKYRQAVENSTIEVRQLIRSSSSPEAVDILETQIELLNDPQMERDVLASVRDDKKNAHDAVLSIIEILVDVFRQMKDPYLSARSADIGDIGNRILDHLGNEKGRVRFSFAPNTILVADDLTPSDTITLDINNVAGLVTRSGGKTSHAAIIARARGIPAVAGCGEALQAIRANDLLLIDGETGLVLANPAEEKMAEYRTKQEAFVKKAELLKKIKLLPSVTGDGRRISLLANIASAEDFEQVFDQGGEGVGLLRTELLFLGNNNFPTEEEQFAFYKSIALKSKGRPVRVRTLDIGGDKQLPYFRIPAEENPALGYRAIRICLDQVDMFKTQLRAILRASAFGNFSILLPMISQVAEIRTAKAILKEVQNDLRKNGIAFDEKIKTGIMIEVPSAAVIADLLAGEADFFSIGTNDLCQYTLAADRMNEKIKDLYEPFHPAVLRLIRFVIEQGDQHQIEVGMCGELASDPRATQLLLGMGLTEFSMHAAAIPEIKNIILQTHMVKAASIREAVMQMNDARNIIGYLETLNP